MTDDDERVLRDLLRFRGTADRIAEKGREVFFDPDDEILRLAARSLVVNVSAAVDRLSPGFRDRFPQVPWSSIRATRNIVAHAYDQVNDRVMWAAVTRDIPALVDELTSESSIASRTASSRTSGSGSSRNDPPRPEAIID